jgi:hypothetical protein
LPLDTSATPPAAGNLGLLATRQAGKMLPAFIGPSGPLQVLQDSLAFNRVGFVQAVPGGTAGTAFALAVASVGTATAAATANSTYGRIHKIDYLVTVAAVNAVAGYRVSANNFSVGGGAANEGGFWTSMVWGPATGVATATNRAFCGMRVNAVPTDVEPSSLTSMVGMGWDAADTNIQLMRNDGSGTATKIDLGAAFPVPTTDRTKMYQIILYSPPGTTQSVEYLVTDLITGATASGTVTTDLPATGSFLAPHVYMSAGGTSSVIGIAFGSIYIGKEQVS